MNAGNCLIKADFTYFKLTGTRNNHQTQFALIHFLVKIAKNKFTLLPLHRFVDKAEQTEADTTSQQAAARTTRLLSGPYIRAGFAVGCQLS